MTQLKWKWDASRHKYFYYDNDDRMFVYEDGSKISTTQWDSSRLKHYYYDVEDDVFVFADGTKLSTMKWDPSREKFYSEDSSGNFYYEDGTVLTKDMADSLRNENEGKP